VTTRAHQPTVTSATNSSRSGPSSEYAVIQKASNSKVPHLTVNSGDKYALSTHDDSLRRVKQQQTMTESKKVSYIHASMLEYMYVHTSLLSSWTKSFKI